MHDALRDLQFGARMLFRSPVFALTCIVLLAAGIGANTLIFSIVNALLLRPLPVAHPETLVRIVEVHPNDFVTWDLPYDFCSGAAGDPDFSEVLCQGEADLPWTSGDSTERVRTHFVSPNFFSSLGVHRILAHILNADDDRTASP